jgi:Lon protease-like protein
MEGSREEIPIFPLSNVVLFPGLQVPLHLFEPRYRQMARDALAGVGRIGMVVVRPEHVAEMAGDPPVFPVGCAGMIQSSEKLPDGRYNIVLAGTERFRVLQEPERPRERLYRVAVVELLTDALDPADTARVAAQRARVSELVAELARRTDPKRAARLPRGFLRDLDDVAFVNALCNALAFQGTEKQGLLEADSIPDRYQRLIALLGFRLAELGPSAVPGSGSLH